MDLVRPPAGGYVNKALAPIERESIRERCVVRLEELIVTGVFTPGERLPAERDLAKQLGISRPIVHEALVDLAVKGLVTITPRIGTVVNDFRREGTISLLTTLLRMGAPAANGILVADLLEVRLLIEVHAAGLAAKSRTGKDIELLESLFAERKKFENQSPRRLAELDFRFHHTITAATGNMIYPLLVNSFREFYLGLAELFYREPVYDFVTELHEKLVAAIRDKNRNTAEDIMTRIIMHGETVLKAKNKENDHGTKG